MSQQREKKSVKLSFSLSIELCSVRRPLGLGVCSLFLLYFTYTGCDITEEEITAAATVRSDDKTLWARSWAH